jgi:uncharacterized membrane protein YbjE (DUF340 family)
MDVVILLAALLAGAAAGRLLRGSGTAAGLNRRLSGASLWGLLVAMGARLAQDGVSPEGAFLLAVGSAVLLAAVFFSAFIVVGALSRAGGAAGAKAGEARFQEAPQGKGGRELLAVATNAGCIAVGFFLFRLLPADRAASFPLAALAAWLLGGLLFFVGFDMGANLHRLNLRLLTAWMLLAPFFNIAVSLSSGLLLGAATSLGARDGGLLGAGMGWYSLSSVMLAERGMAALALLAFVHNVARELLAILCAPLAARVSPLLPVYLGGATSMDVMLPFVQRYSGREYTLFSFYSGAVCSLAVMPLVSVVARAC